jgi:hypothetical protein
MTPFKAGLVNGTKRHGERLNNARIVADRHMCL